MTSKNRGWAHQQRAAQLRGAFKDGDICRRCGQPMWHWQPLDAGHPPSALPLDDQPNGTLPDAIEHRACNRRAGQLVGARSPKRRRRHLPNW